MKRSLLVLLALLMVAGTAHAFVGVVDPKTTNGAASVKLPVHNDSTNSQAFDAGDVVIVDISSSTGTNDLYVAYTTTASTGLVVGVVWPNAIASGNSGSVVVYGMAECDILAGASANSTLCTSATGGSGATCASGADHYAVTSAALVGAGQVACWVNP